MFPLHEGTIYILALLAIAGGMAAFTALRGWIGLWRTAAILGVGLAWPWPVAAFLGLNGYTIAVALYLSAWTAGGLLVGLAWGLLAGRIAGPIAVLAVAITPTLAGAA